MMKLKRLFTGLFFVLVVVLFSLKMGPLPRLGMFFSPSQGYVKNGLEADETIPEFVRGSLIDKATIHFDGNGVPYIFAENNHDLFVLQGYVAARDRLFQMEVSTRLTSGRLAEWLGNDLIENDRYFRRLGLSAAAERATEKAMNDSVTAEILTAYAQGVNIYIESLSKEDYPIEYKLLDIEPERWEPLKTILVLKNITYTLTGFFNDLRNSNTRALFGESFFTDVLFKDFDELQPIISELGNTVSKKEPAPFNLKNYFKADLTKQKIPIEPDADNGSNNWALRASKTKNGKPILSSDPHLTMSLPSIWYEQSLNTPEFSAHGVNIPGAPCISIGFTPFLSWGVTNSGSDVADFYQITFRDSTMAEYLFDGKWLPTTIKKERIKNRDGSDSIENVVYTHHGPVVFNSDSDSKTHTEIPFGAALRWVAYEDGNELNALFEMLKSQSVKQYTKALSDFGAPALNWAFASSTDTIGMWVNGKIPKKWDYQGMFIADGSSSAYDWKESIPFDDLPHEINPKRNFVSSANQIPVSDTYPYYFDYKMAGFSRPNRINQLLSEKNDFMVEDIQKMQLDSYSLVAKKLVPVYLHALSEIELPDSMLVFKHLIESWDFVNEDKQIAPSIFHQWRRSLHKLTWDELDAVNVPISKPWLDNTDWLVVENPTSIWFDKVDSNQKETSLDLIQEAFSDAIKMLKNQFGSSTKEWIWAKYNKTDLKHIAGIPGFNSGYIATSGFSESINAIRGTHGPSWRMVVEMDAWNSWAYVTYPGGQSGNPGSVHYLDRLESWRVNKGKVVKLYPSADKMKTASYTWEF